MHTIAWWPIVGVVTVATYTDVRSRRIPNWLVLPFLLAGLVVSTWQQGWHGLGQSFAGLGLGLLIYGTLCWMGGMGMGDVKLCGAIGAWIGPEQLLFALLLIGIVGGVMALAWAIKDGFVGELFRNAGELVIGVKDRGLRPHPEMTLKQPRARKIPYAPAIAIGTIVSFLAF